MGGAGFGAAPRFLRIISGIKQADGNVSEAARLLGIDSGRIYRICPELLPEKDTSH